MMGPMRGVRVLGGIALLGAFAAPAPAADAGIPSTVRTADGVVDGGATDSAEPRCVGKERPLGSGLRITSAAPGDRAFLYRFRRAGKRRYEVGTFSPQAGADPISYRASVICSRLGRHLRPFESGPYAISNGEFEFAGIACEPDEIAIAAAFANPEFEGGPSQQLPYRSEKVKRRSWSVGTFNAGAISTVRMHAICALRSKLRVETRRRNATLQPGATRSIKRRCRKGWTAIAGGFESEFGTVPNRTGHVIESHRAGRRGWRVTFGYQGGLGAPLAIGVQAVCAKRR